MSAIQGGPGFPFLSPKVYIYLCKEIWSPTQLRLEDVPDALKQVVNKFFDAKTDHELRAVFMEDEAMLTQLINVGYNKAVTNLTLSDRSEVISSILEFNLFIKVKAAMDQFREGLDSVGLLPPMKQYEDLLRPLFADDGAVLRVGMLKSLLSPKFSEPGSNKRAAEEAAYIFFVDFLDDCRGESQCTLQNVLVFVSGACTIPPCGFGKPGSLEFLHSPEAILPTSSTCDITLRIPTCLSDYDTFKDMMTLGMLGHDGFGGV